MDCEEKVRLVAEDMAPGESLPGTLGDVVCNRELSGTITEHIRPL